MTCRRCGVLQYYAVERGRDDRFRSHSGEMVGDETEARSHLEWLLDEYLCATCSTTAISTDLWPIHTPFLPKPPRTPPNAL